MSPAPLLRGGFKGAGIVASREIYSHQCYRVGGGACCSLADVNNTIGVREVL